MSLPFSIRCARQLLIAALLGLGVFAPSHLFGLDYVKMRRDGRETSLTGRVLVTAEDGGLLLETPDGVLWAVQPQEIAEHKTDDAPFRPSTMDELARQMQAGLPSGFEIYTTSHYLVCYNTSREYAVWCGALFERLYRAFTNYWSRKGFELHEPEFPLVAVVFGDRDAYVRYSQDELGAAAGSIVGYYSLRSNRVNMYDLTGVDSLRVPGERRTTAAQINKLLARPEAEQTVATIIHEATHQIAFNSGLQTRFADIPLWVSEGLAVYFETPDLQSAKGWSTIGSVNRSRLARFREYLPNRSSNSLRTLLADDKRIRDPRLALDAYAEAWALNYYLNRQHPKEYVEYLKVLSAKRQLLWDDPDGRLKEFQKAFGDIDKLDTDFVRQMLKVR